MLLMDPPHKRKDALLANLQAARDLVVRKKYRKYMVYSPSRFTRSYLYDICREAWESNHHQGYYHDIPNALRRFVPDGDLTEWWTWGRDRDEVLALFDRALGVRELVAA